MTWMKVDDNLAFHPKVIAAGNCAMGLWVRAGSWSAQQLTDGRVPAAMIAVLGGTQEDADALCSAGLWHETLEGYEFHDWEARQPTRAEVEAKREEAAERMRRHRANRSRELREKFANPDPTRPDPTRTSKVVESAPKRATRGTRLPADFELSPELIEYTREKAPGIDIEKELETFRDWWAAAPGQKGVKLDWAATWRTWARRAQERAETNGWKPSSSIAQMPSQRTARDRWLAARGVSADEYERRKGETGWLESLKEIS